MYTTWKKMSNRMWFLLRDVRGFYQRKMTLLFSQLGYQLRIAKLTEGDSYADNTIYMKEFAPDKFVIYHIVGDMWLGLGTGVFTAEDLRNMIDERDIFEIK